MENALIDQPADAKLGSPQHAGAPAPTRKAAWQFDVRGLVMIGLLLGASGAYRYWRDYQFATLEAQSRDCPFPLKDLSPVQGSWRSVEGAEATLAPEIARIAGSTDHIIRSYANEKTGEKVTVLVLYGPSQLVWAHTPEVCYPSTGYKPLVISKDVTVPGVDGEAGTLFRHGVYGRTDAGAVRMSEVFHSFRNAGLWTPEMASRWKQFRYNPGMFKVQVERSVQDADSRGEACYDLLAAMVADIEGRLRPASAPVASTP